MNIAQMLIPKGALARPGRPLESVESITVHWIGPYPKQSVETPLNWWLKGPNGEGIEASAHFIVKDNECIQCIPLNEIAWHAGCVCGNYHSIGIETVPMDTEGAFSEHSISTLRTLYAHICKKLNKQLPLKRHYDWTKKDCPRWYTPLVEGGPQRWEDLIARVCY